jgi:hypothetical protein
MIATLTPICPAGKLPVSVILSESSGKPVEIVSVEPFADGALVFTDNCQDIDVGLMFPAKSIAFAVN